jgi:hypothetical protein
MKWMKKIAYGQLFELHAMGEKGIFQQNGSFGHVPMGRKTSSPRERDYRVEQFPFRREGSLE